MQKNCNFDVANSFYGIVKKVVRKNTEGQNNCKSPDMMQCQSCNENIKAILSKIILWRMSGLNGSNSRENHFASKITKHLFTYVTIWLNRGAASSIFHKSKMNLSTFRTNNSFHAGDSLWVTTNAWKIPSQVSGCTSRFTFRCLRSPILFEYEPNLLWIKVVPWHSHEPNCNWHHWLETQFPGLFYVSGCTSRFENGPGKPFK